MNQSKKLSLLFVFCLIIFIPLFISQITSNNAINPKEDVLDESPGIIAEDLILSEQTNILV
ncbi:MAG: hypothetical protein SCK28_08705, partial [Bacillota bacterium]|nr:hypothetical protein [Bacillota bacterium]